MGTHGTCSSVAGTTTATAPPDALGDESADLRDRPIAHLSVDLDPIDTHLAGYGFAAPGCDIIYRAAVPRLFELLDRLGLRATLFVIARDAEAHAPLWREAKRRGHEIASHSVTHPIPFASLPGDRLARELLESRQRLEDATGNAVLGFRAPGWDVSLATLRAIARAGYRYDASLLPTPALLAGNLLRCVLSGGRYRPHGIGRGLRTAFMRRRPHRVRGADGLMAFPIAVSPWLRLPFTHTLWYVAPPAISEGCYRLLRRSQEPLSYMLHGADLLDLRHDGIDARMGRHPGMQLSLEDKLALLERTLRRIAADYRVTTYADFLATPQSAGGGALLRQEPP